MRSKQYEMSERGSDHTAVGYRTGRLDSHMPRSLPYWTGSLSHYKRNQLETSITRFMDTWKTKTSVLLCGTPFETRRDANHVEIMPGNTPYAARMNSFRQQP
ncbi:hypothetical protein BaRGS_00016230 [Batillaria attramentaria]|uniref:Uncharacterized protein n=1 Tax=Batillaria attramentaria TaxID=370345 RepID=A0ABD0L0I0_9CAEN